MKPTLIKSDKLYTFTSKESYNDMVHVITIETLGLYSSLLRDTKHAIHPIKNGVIIQDVQETDYRAAISWLKALQILGP